MPETNPHDIRTGPPPLPKTETSKVIELFPEPDKLDDADLEEIGDIDATREQIEKKYKPDILKAKETRQATIEAQKTPHGEYSIELDEGGKDQQDSTGAFTTVNDSGELESWMIVADGVSTSKDGAIASSRLVEIIHEKIRDGIHPKEAIEQASRQFTHEIDLDIARHETLASIDKTLGKKKVDIGCSDPELNPLLATTFVATKINENGSTTAFLLGDGQVYKWSKRSEIPNTNVINIEKNQIPTGEQPRVIHKIQNGQMTEVQDDKEQRKYNNPIELQLRRKLESGVQGSFDFVTLFNQGKIELTGNTRRLVEDGLVKKPDGTMFIDKTKLSTSTLATIERFAKKPKEIAEDLQEIELGILEPGDIVIVCSDGVENNILSSEIVKLIEQSTENKKTDINKLRRMIGTYVKKMINVKITKDNIAFEQRTATAKEKKFLDQNSYFDKIYAKPDNFSLIVYLQTEKGTERIKISEEDIDNALDALG